MRSKPYLFYLVMLTGCLTGYAWLSHAVTYPQSEVTVCLIKNTTGLPCPSCGTTRSVAALAQGDWLLALQLNPLGMIVAIIMVTAPIWIGFDMRTGKTSLHSFILRAERFLQQKWVAAPVILLILLNWIWSFSKGL